MSIPDFQTIMLPLLRYAADGDEHRVRDGVDALADHFNLTAAEREQLVPSGQQRTFSNRVTWAVSYLKQAKLLDSPARGQFRITHQGATLLASPPERITIAFLSDLSPEFREFREAAVAGTRRRQRAQVVALPTIPRGGDEQTPEEQMEAADQTLRRALEHDLLERVKASSPEFFERIVLHLLVAMGYGGSLVDAAEHLGRSGDDGVDGVINEDRLGLDVVHVQAKRWAESPVRRPDVQAFTGSLEGQRSRKGVLITTSHFTRDALEYVDRIEKRIVLIDGEELARLMIDHRVGVSELRAYSVLRLDEAFFEESES
jgi:restriction system protein